MFNFDAKTIAWLREKREAALVVHLVTAGHGEM
jgi:hypothetical protein